MCLTCVTCDYDEGFSWRTYIYTFQVRYCKNTTGSHVRDAQLISSRDAVRIDPVFLFQSRHHQPEM